MTGIDVLAERFRARGLRVTPQRQVVFGLLYGNDEHPTVEALFGSAREVLPTISLKTVYQTVHDLEDLGEVRLLAVGTGSVRVDPVRAICRWQVHRRRRGSAVVPHHQMTGE